MKIEEIKKEYIKFIIDKILNEDFARIPNEKGSKDMKYFLIDEGGVWRRFWWYFGDLIPGEEYISIGGEATPNIKIEAISELKKIAEILKTSPGKRTAYPHKALLMNKEGFTKYENLDKWHNDFNIRQNVTFDGVSVKESSDYFVKPPIIQNKIFEFVKVGVNGEYLLYVERGTDPYYYRYY